MPAATEPNLPRQLQLLGKRRLALGLKDKAIALNLKLPLYGIGRALPCEQQTVQLISVKTVS